MKKILNKLMMLVVAFAFIGNLSSQTCPSSLVGYWQMDETSGTNLADEIANNDATRNASTGNVSGIIDNSQRFTFSYAGTYPNNYYTDKEYASVPNNAAFNFGKDASFTISYWVKMRDCGVGFQDHIAVSKGDWNGGGGLADGMFASGFNGSCRINFLLRDNTGYKIDLEGPAYYDTETWYHVACVRDDASNKNILYVNGDITDQETYNYAGGFSNSMSLYFGALVNFGDPQYIFKGDLDEVAIFNTALSASEIDEIITDGHSGTGVCSAVATPPAITSTPVTTGTVDLAYTYDVNATGDATIVYSLTTSPAGMTINSSTGVISWTPTVGGNFNVTVVADNDIEPNATQSFTVTVTGDNPTITSTPVTTGTVDEAYSYDVNASGTQSGMVYSLSVKPTGMTINASTGVISWTPAAPGAFSVRVKADNTIAPADSQTFTITVAGINPDITSTPVTEGFFGSPYTYDVNASGKQSTMVYSLSIKPVGMTINATTGVISWTPAAAGDFSVRVKAENGIAPADSQSYTITVVEESLCPEGIISLHKLDEASGSVYADFYDEHNATASVSPTATAGIINGAQIFNASTKINIPDNGTEFDWLAKSSFSIECWMKTSTTQEMVCVGRNRTDYAGATSWWIGTNGSGQAFFRLRGNGPTMLELSGNSNVADGNWHHIIGVRNSATNTNLLYVDGILQNSGSVTYTNTFKADNALAVNIGYINDASERHFIGSIDEVTIFNRAISASEASTYYNGGTPTGHCKGSNNPPYFTSSPVTSVNEDAAYSYTATVNDADGDPLTISIQTKPAWATFNTSGSSATITGTPANSNVGDNDVVLRVSDGDLTRDQIFRIAVANVNDAPVKTSTPVLTVNEDAAYSYILTVNDIDLYDVISMTAVNKPSWLTFTYSAGALSATLSGTPTNDNVGAAAVSIRITDGTATIYENYTITVNGVNDAPVITGQNVLSVNEDASLLIIPSNLTITDVDNSSSDITIAVQSGTNYTVSGNTITPAANFNGQLSVNVIASDLALSSAPYAVVVTVNSVNDSPVITTSPTTSVEEGNMYTYTLTVTDVDVSDIITMSAVTLPSWLTFSWTAGSKTATISGTPLPANQGANAIDISITDQHITIHQTYTLNVIVNNDAPVITGQSGLSVDEDNSITILKSNLTIVDPDNSQSDITITVQTGNNYSISGNTVTPDENFNGQLSVKVIARDLLESSAVYNVVVTVNPVNDKPVITSVPVENGSVGNLYVYVLAATDPDNSTLMKSAITLPGWLTFSSTTGALTGVPTLDNLGQHLVLLQVSDGVSVENQMFTITVHEFSGISVAKADEFTIYPVPVKNKMNIKFYNLSEETVVNIISTTGSIVETITVPANTDIATIPTDGIKAGFYIVHVMNNKTNATYQVAIVE